MNKLILILSLCITCSSQPDQEKGVATQVEPVQTSTVIAKRVSVDEFDEIVKRDNIQLVDVRTPGEYAAGAFDGAQNIDYLGDEFIATCEKKLEKSEPVVVYCAAGGRSAKAMNKLKEAGFREIYELGVGYSGYPY